MKPKLSLMNNVLRDSAITLQQTNFGTWVLWNLYAMKFAQVLN